MMSKLLELSQDNNSESYKLLERIYKEQYEQRNKIDEKSTEQCSSSKDRDDPRQTSGQTDREATPTPQDDQQEKDSEEEIETICPKQGKDIKSSSVQSIHDPQACYRTKGKGASKQTVSGYHANITESCDEDEDVHLILDVEVQGANICEDAFLLNGITGAQQVLDRSGAEEKQIDQVITDGGYDSVENRNEMLKEENPNWQLAKMKGAVHVFEMSYNETGTLEVNDKNSQTKLDVKYSDRAQKYVITTKQGKKRYMTKVQIEDYIAHQQIVDQVDKQSYNLRASVESTINQSFHRLEKNNKIKYRGLLKCQWYVLSRAFWVNVVRIRDKKMKNNLELAIMLLIYSLKALIVKRTLKQQFQLSYY